MYYIHMCIRRTVHKIYLHVRIKTSSLHTLIWSIISKKDMIYHIKKRYDLSYQKKIWSIISKFYTYVHVQMYIHVPVQMYNYIHIQNCIYIHVQMYIYTSIQMYIFIPVNHTSVFTCHNVLFHSTGMHASRWESSKMAHLIFQV